MEKLQVSNVFPIGKRLLPLGRQDEKVPAAGAPQQGARRERTSLNEVAAVQVESFRFSLSKIADCATAENV